MSGLAGKTSEKGSVEQRDVRVNQRSQAQPSGSHDSILALQRAAGNRAVTNLLAKGSGRPLDVDTREEMEAKFGEDFRDLRVHADGAAAASASVLNANAFTAGKDIAFGEGRYSPQTSGGKTLLAHELAHVVQQRRGGAAPRTFEPEGAAERDAAGAAGAFAAAGPVSVNSATGKGVARQEAKELPWWKKRLNPLYQRALEVLPKEASEKLELANAAAKQFVEKTGATDEGLNQAVQVAEPVLKPIADYLGVKSEAQPVAKAEADKRVTWLGTPPIDVQLKQRREQQAQQAALNRTDPGALADPVEKKNAQNLPLGAGLFLKQDPDPTEFETKLQAGKSFPIKSQVKPDLDPRKVTWAGKRPTDEQMKHMRFEDVNDPSRKIWADDKEVNLKIDPSAVMPIRDPKTHELKGYRYRDGDTMTVLDRDGEIKGNYNLEKPLEHPAIDPIDIAMLGADVGPMAAKGIQAGGKALLKAMTKSGTRELGEAGGEEASKLLGREASEALERGVSHPRDFPEIDLGGTPANDVRSFESSSVRPAEQVFPDEGRIRLGDSLRRPANDVLPPKGPQSKVIPLIREQAQAEEGAMARAAGQDFSATPSEVTVASAGRGSGSPGPRVGAPGRTVASGGTSSAARTVPRGAVGGGALGEGPTIARYGEDEVKELTGMWEKRLAAETDRDRAREIEGFIRSLKNRGRPGGNVFGRGYQAEEEAVHIYSQIGGKGETAFKVEGAGGATRITKPDFDAPNVRGEVKNWEMIHIQSESTAEGMLKNLEKQVEARRNIMPFKDQTVILDVRGQNLTEDQLQKIGKTFSERTGLPPKKIQIVTWAKAK